MRIQYIAILGSCILLLFIFELIRRKKIKEEYSLLWLFFGVIFLIFSFWRKGLEVLSNFLGIAYAPASLFLLLLMAFFFILIQFSLVISDLSESKKIIIQELALLKQEVDKRKKKQNEVTD